VLAWVVILLCFVLFCAGYDLSEAGLLSVLPYCFNFIAVMGSGRLFDYLQVGEGGSVKE
jgi:hypothetical protein